MTDPVKSASEAPESNISEKQPAYKKDFWGQENLKFSQPWYRLQKSARIINKLARGKECTLLDVGCGPTTLMRLLPPNIQYFGIDIAIQNPTPNLKEADLVESAIGFDGRSFDLVTALGVFEYLGDSQSRKFAEIARLMNAGGSFVVTYTNFAHRKTRIYEAFSNIQSLDNFSTDLRRYFNIEKSFPASHNWKHSQPNRELIKTLNMYVNMNIPIVSPVLGVDYFFICSPLKSTVPVT